jgi:beta-glucosidase
MQLMPENRVSTDVGESLTSQPREQSSSNVLKFPADFLWGVSTSHFQIEGNPEEIAKRASDWAAWTAMGGKILDQSTADLACDFFSRYEADVQLCRDLNLNTFRLSLNWAALVPARGAPLNPQSVAFYRRLLQTIKDSGMQTFVTLFHFCLPTWLSEVGGWNNELAIEEFERFTEMVVAEFGDLTDFWLTLNEPLAYVYQGYIDGGWPPGHHHNWLGGFRAIKNMLHGHAAAYKVIHRLKPGAKVSFTVHWIPFQPRRKWNLFDHMVRYLRDAVFNHVWMNAVQTGSLQFPIPLRWKKEIKEICGPIEGLKDTMDYLGINYYTRQFCEFEYSWPPGLFGVKSDWMELETSALGWEIYPQGLYDTLTSELRPYMCDAKGNQRDVYITENGFASMFSADLTDGDWSLDDDIRVKYLVSHLVAVHRAIAAGVKVKGYLHWSLLDNFEWAEGLRARFGLVRVAYPTLERTLRNSARVYAEIAGNNALMKQ